MIPDPAHSPESDARLLGPGPSMRVYFGTYTQGASEGIYCSRFDPVTGRLSAAELAGATTNPSLLAVHPGGQLLYAVGELDHFNGRPEGAISAFRINPGTGRLTLLHQVPSGGKGPCHVALDRTGTCVLAANYGSGSIIAFAILPDGKLGEPGCRIQHQGSSVHRQRQAGPHAHFMVAAPDNRFALACDLGLDKVLVYRLDPGKAALVPNDPPFAGLKPGAGPRHLAFHPNGRILYVINEIDSTITAMQYDSARGVLGELQSVTLLPSGFTGQNSGAAVQVHPSGRFLYASNRGHDSIVVFSIDPTTGKLDHVQHQFAGGKVPRHICLDPSGHWLLAANQGSGNIVVFAVDARTGRLGATGNVVKLDAPVCAVFVPPG